MYERISLHQLFERRKSLVPRVARFRGRFPRHVRGARDDAQPSAAAPTTPRPSRHACRFATTGWTSSRAVRRSRSRRRRTAACRRAPNSIIAVAEAQQQVAVHRGRRRADRAPSRDRFRAAAARARFGMRAKRRHGATVHSSGRVFNDWLDARPRRYRAADHRARDRALSLCGHPVVLDGVRPRRRDLRAADAVAQSGPGARRAVLPGRAPGDRDLAVQRFRSRARSCTKRARARWRCCANCRSAATMAASIRRRSTSISPPPMPTGPATWSSSTRCGRRSAPPPTGWRRRAAQRQRLRHLPARSRIRPLQPGLEGQLRFRSSMPTAGSRRGRSRWSRCRATSLPPIRGLAALAARRGEDANGRALGGQRREDARRGRDAFLDGGPRLLCAGDRRRRRALHGAHLECRPSALCRAAVARTGAARRRPAALRALPQRLGNEDARRRRGPRSTRCPTTTARSGRTTPRSARPALRAIGERDSVVRLMSGTFEAAVHFNMRLAGTVLRLYPRCRRSAGRLSRRLPAAGLVGGIGVHADAGLPGPARSTAGTAKSGSTGRGCRSASTTSPPAPRGGRRTKVDIIFERIGDRVVGFLDHRHEGLVPLVVRS